MTSAAVSRDVVLAITGATFDDDGVIHFRFISGNPEDPSFVYDEKTGSITPAPMREGTWLASLTRVSVVPEERLLLIENRRRGVSATNLERYFENIARIREFSTDMQMDLDPLPSPSLEREIEELARIREAALIVNRPNSDWDDAHDVISELADESGGQKAQVVVTAGRGESLSKTEGVVGIIRRHLRRPLSNLRSLRVVGRRFGESIDRTLTLEKHQVRRAVTVDPRLPQDQQDEVIFGAAKDLIGTAIPIVRERADHLQDDQAR
ncbi:hypothetical protein M3G91_30120 [Micromonospora chalcea]|uniref:hypothetical protein n=1 Tax=Micromonospora chalcea TaxID=1874 RepID=UPI0021A73E73|nr:hypothetical protein [Micromonospora chalcea]MCT2281861.1 hypothetical protein [Micromonospora chalcea]